MKHRLISMLTIPVVAICFGVAAGSYAIAQSADAESAKTLSGDRDCSNRTISGAYGSASQRNLHRQSGLHWNGYGEYA
jgi:hypothetical protein